MTTLPYKAAGEIRGDDILPLNDLRTHYPDLYERHFAKYAERPNRVNSPVYPLDCTWADIPHILHRGPILKRLFRTSAGTPVVS